MNYYPHLNDIFISERLKRRLNEVNTYPITTVIAPMGFGKTTAMNWWSKRQKKVKPMPLFYVKLLLRTVLRIFGWASAGPSKATPN